MRQRSKYLLAIVGLMAGGVGTGPVRGEPPAVGFDVGLTVACRDVTPEPLRSKGTGKVIEAVFRLSPEILRGKEADLKRIRYEVYGPDEQTPVLCFAPGSVVGTEVVDGVVEIESSEGGGEISVHYVVSRAAGRGEAGAEWRRSTLRYKLLAPRALLLATGTTRRGSGVYYDLRPSTQDTLQRQREFAVVFEVPPGWRADYVTVECRADGYDRGVLLTDEGVCGLAMFSVGLYLEGNDEAKASADALAKSQEVYFRRLTEERRKVLEGRRTRSLNWGSVLSFLDWVGSFSGPGATASGNAKVVGSVVNGLMFRAGDGSGGRVEKLPGDLPPAVRDSFERLKERQEAVRRLNGRK
jgi:hypothetical protein